MRLHVRCDFFCRRPFAGASLVTDCYMGNKKSANNRDRSSESEVKRVRRTGGGDGGRDNGSQERSTLDTARWILGVMVIMLGLIAFFAVIFYFAYWKSDYAAVFTPETDNPRFDDSVRNPCGKVGVIIADAFVNRSFGLFGLLIPSIFIFMGIRLITRKSAFLNHTTLSVVLVMIFGSLTLGLAFGDSGVFNSGWGGSMGIAVSTLMTDYIGIVGSWIIVILCWILTGVFINRNFINAMNSAGNAAIEQGGQLVERVVDRAGGLLHRSRGEETVSEGEVVQRDLTDTSVAGADGEEENPDAGDEMPVPEEARNDYGESDVPSADEPEEKEEEDDAAAGEDVPETEPAGEDQAEGQRTGVKTITVEEHRAAMMDEKSVDRRPFDPDHTPNYKFPPVDFLVDYVSESTVTDEEIIFNKRQIEETLGNFGIPIREMKATIGPTVTLYEIVQEAGVKISRIQGLENDIAQSLKALGIRIIAPIPGRGTIGIEVPNRNKEIVSMRSAVQSERFHRFAGELPVVIGRTIQNENYVFDLAKMPHLLVAGATGQGKSVGLNAIIASLLYRKDPSQLKFVLIDPKMVEFTVYAKLEKHFLAKMSSEDEAIVTDPKKAVYTLNSLCIEMDTRLDKCRKAGARNIVEYNDKVRRCEVEDRNIMPYIVVIIDEFADLIMTAKEVEGPVMRLAQKARAIGIHLIVATQRPDVKVITGGIKANFPARIAYRVMQMIDSRTIIDQPGANQLIGRGDMLLSKDGELTRIQCALIDTKETIAIVDYISTQPSPDGRSYDLPEYDEKAGQSSEPQLGSESGAPVKYDPLFAEIARDAVASGQISTSYIQRNYEVGFNRAGRIMTQLERAGIVGPQVGAKQREIKFYDMPSLEAKLQELGLS